MKKIFTIYLLIFISSHLVAQDLNAQSAVATKSQKFTIPEKLWKIECQGMAENANILRFPLNDGTLGVMFTRKDTIHYPFIFIGNICDLVKGNNNSTVYIGAGKALIKPCSGSDEKDIEISSEGLNFIYQTGIGLEYESGNGTIKMFDKTYKLPINEVTPK